MEERGAQYLHWLREIENMHLVVPSMLVKEGDDGLDVVLLDDVQNLGAFN